MDNLWSLLAHLLTDIKRRLTYPAALVWSFVSTLILFVIQVSLWKYARLGDDAAYTITYFAVVALLRPFLSVGTARRLQERFNTGSIVYDAVRPTRFARLQGLQDVASAIVAFFAVSVPAVLLIEVLYDLAWVPWRLLPVFVVSVVFAYAISWSIGLLAGCTVFHLKDNEGVLLLHHTLVPLLSGAIVPLEVLPPSIAAILRVLPFRSMYDLPIRIFTSSSLADVGPPFMLQAIWLIVLMGAATVVSRSSIRKIEVYGG